MNNVEYWAERALLQEKRSHQQGDKVLSNLRKEYTEAQKNLQKQMEEWYQKYADEKGISVAQAKKKLTGREYRNHCKNIEQFIDKAKTGDAKYDDILRRRYIASRVNRLQALQNQVAVQLELLGKSQDRQTFKLLQEVYKDTFYNTAQTLTGGIRGRFDRLDAATVERICQTPWSGKSFSERIWQNNKKLIAEARHILSQGTIMGSSIEKMSRELAKRMKVDYNRAECLIRTETAYIREQATADTYKELGIAQYEYLATLDKRTSAVCRSLDKQIFALKERMIGVNYPPMHPRCRSTTVPYFPEDSILAQGETRAARDENGKTVRVDAKLSYYDWHQKYVEAPELLREAGLKVFIGRAMYDRMDIRDWQQIAKDIRRMPPEHLAYVNEHLDKVDYISASPWLEQTGFNSHYDHINKVVYLRSDLEDGEFAHELGHLFEYELDIYNNAQYMAILDDVVKDLHGIGSIVTTGSFSRRIALIVDNGKFVSEYQRYVDMDIFYDFKSIGEHFPGRALTEYLSEGYHFYIINSVLLKQKNQALYDYIAKEMIKAE